MGTTCTPRGWCSTLALMLVIAVMAVVSSWSPVRAEGEDLIFGGPGTGNGQFTTSVHGLDTDAAGNIYVLDGGTVDSSGNITGGLFRVQKFNSAGVYQSQFSVYDAGLGVNNTPTRIAVSDAGEVFILITNANQVRRYVNGVLTTTYNVSTAKSPLYQNDWGNDPGASNAGGIYVRTLSNVPYLFVVLNNGTTVRKFTISNGTYTDITLSRGASLVTDLAVQNNGNLYILGTDAVSGGGCLIMAFGPTGTWIKNYGSGVFDRNASGFAFGDIARHFVEVDSQGNLYSMACVNEANLIKYAVTEGKIYYRQAQFGFGDPYSIHGSDVFMAVGRDDRMFCLPTNWFVSTPGHHDSPVVTRLVTNYFSNFRRLGALGLGVTYEGTLPYNISYNLNPISFNFVVSPATRVVHTLNVNYQVYDMYKTAVASGNFTLNLTDGVGTTQAVTFTPPKYGWYDVTFTMYDTTQTEANFLMRTSTYYGVTPTYTGAMSAAAAETLSAGESVGGWTDIPRHAFSGLPYMRIDSGYSLTDIQGLITQAAQYGVQPVIMFENTTECAQAHVEEVVNYFDGQGLYYEVINEPDLFMSADTYVTYLQNVYTWVKAIDPNAKVMGPATCGVNLGYIQRIYDLGMKNYFDILSVHDYEGHESIDPKHWVWKFGQLRAIMAANGDSAKQIWQTESGLAAIRGGNFLGSVQAIRATLRADVLDGLGIPVSHSFYYYMNVGGWTDTMYIWTGTGPFPTPIAMRTRYAMTRGTLPTAQLDFGTTGNKLFYGFRYTAGGSNIALLRNLGSEPNMPLTLNVTGGSTITVIDAFGNETTQAVSGGQVTLDVPMMPIYLRLAAGQDVSVPTVNYGTNIAYSASFSYTSTYNGSFSILKNGINEVHPPSNPNTTLWWGDLPSYPQTLEMTFPTQRNINKVLIFGSRADNQFCTLLDFDLQYWNSTTSSWDTIQQVRTNCPPTDEMDMGDHSAQQWMLDQNYHHLTFAPVTTDKLRVVVYRSTFGFDPDQVSANATLKAWGAYNPEKLTLHEIEVYTTDPPVTGPNADISIAADNGYELYINGTLIGTGDNWQQAGIYVDQALQSGTNVIAIKGIDAGGVAALIADMTLNDSPVVTNSGWKVSNTLQTGWNTAGFNDSTWANATEYGSYGVAPWGTGVSGMPGGTTAKWIWSADNNNDDNVYLRYTFTVTDANQVAMPTFSPAAGAYTSAQSVTISCATSGATIRYTTNGSDPTATSTQYTAPITVNSTTTIKARAFKTGMTDSDIASATYNIATSPLTNFFTQLYSGSRNNFTGNVGYEFTPSSTITVTALGRAVSGAMAQNHDVKLWRVSDQALVASVTVTPSSLTDALGYKYEMLGTPVTLTSGAKYRITSYETTGGDAWMDLGSLSAHQTTATVDQGAFSSDTGYPSSVNGSPNTGYLPPTFYTGTSGGLVATPTFSAAAGTDIGAKSVTISTTTSGASIRYTTDGSDPTSTTGTVYSAPVTLNSSCTLKAIAYKSGLTDSSVASASYTIIPVAGWFDAAESITTDGTNHVTQWANSAPGGNTSVVFNGTAGTGPTLVSSAVNGLPALQFTGTGGLDSVNAPNLGVGFPGGTDCTLVLVKHSPSSDPAGTLFDTYGLQFTHARWYAHQFQGWDHNWFSNSNTYGGTTTVLTVTMSGGSPGTMSVYLNGTCIQNGWPEGATVGRPGGDATEISLGKNHVPGFGALEEGGGSGNLNNCYIPEIMMFSSSLSDTQRETVEAYLFNKYGISATPSVATPTFSPAAGTYSSAQSVTLNCATSGATIRYTTDGNDPTATSTQYTGAIAVNSTTTLKARAFKSGLADSAIASATYTINIPTLTNFFTNAYNTGTRNNYNGNLGYEFTPASNITVVALGRAVSTSMLQNHDIKIWRVSDQAVVATVTVTPSSPTDALGYKYEMLGTAVTLTAGAQYRITSSEYNGGDKFRNINTLPDHLATATLDRAVVTSGYGYPTQTGTAGRGYVPPTFYTSN